MVDWMAEHHPIDPSRVFVTGLSAGGAMTSVMLATYPDVFAAGAIVAGLPYRCATTVGQAYACMNPGTDKSPAEWGKLVRQADPGYAGPYPRVSIWHGASDTTVSPNNVREMVDQWTSVHGIDSTADATGTMNGTQHAEYRDASGTTLVESWLVPQMAHGTPVDPGYSPAGGCGAAGPYILDVNLCSTYFIGMFFGLDAEAGPGPDDPGTAGSGGSPAQGGAGGAPEGQGGAASQPPATSCEEIYDANYDHVAAGRADRCGIGGSYVCARGSKDNLGLYTMMPTWIRMTGPAYYEAGRCP
jgi:hypothetical protein